MTCLVAGSEAFELDSKAGSPVTLSPLLFGRVAQLYHTRLQRQRWLVSSSVSSLLATPKRSDTTPRLARILPDARLRQSAGLLLQKLNLKGMQRLWGRKVSDLAFGEFLRILQWVATKKGKQVVFIDPWYPSSKTCAHCGHVLDSLELSVREWRCPSCRAVNGRDENAALNIQRVGASTLGLGDVRQAVPAIAV